MRMFANGQFGRSGLVGAGLAVLFAFGGCAPQGGAEVAAAPAPAATSAAIATLDARAAKRQAELTKMRQPNGWFEKQLKSPPVVMDGQRLHPKLQYEFETRRAERTASGIKYNEWLMGIWSTPEGRKRLRSEVDINWTLMAEQMPPLAREEVRTITGANGVQIPVKIYSTSLPSAGPKPVLVYFHGGGFIMASVKAVEPQMRILASEGNMVVVSVDYQLAPEAPFPAAFEDAIAAYRWVLGNLNDVAGGQVNVGVGGDSAGGNMAVIVSEEAARQGYRKPSAQLLYYPTLTTEFERFPSYDMFGDGYGLDKNFINLATREVVTDPAMLKHRWLNPLTQADLKAQPPSIVVAAGFDPIRDHSLAYAKALKAAGVKSDLVVATSLNHGFLESSGVIDDAHRICFETARATGRLLRR